LDGLLAQAAIAAGSGYGPDTPLSDPEICGEDLAANLDIAVRLAPTYCHECLNSHEVWAVRRLVTASAGIDSDRHEMIGIIRTLVAKAAESRPGLLDLVIPGSADTGILATCAYAASTLGEETLSRLRFTVVDLCETPLAQCRAYAGRHGLAFRAIQADLGKPLPDLQADLVVLHSILHFLPFDRQIAFLAELGDSLRPGGRILASNALRPNEEAFKSSMSNLATLAREAQDRGEIKPEIPVDAIFARRINSRREFFDYATAEEFRVAFATSGLRVESEVSIERMRKTRAGEKRRPMLRVIATLSKGEQP
jgi:SAM-dependent methyltransferase